MKKIFSNLISQFDRKSLRLFGLAALGIWVFMIIVIYALIALTEPSLDDFKPEFAEETDPFQDQLNSFVDESFLENMETKTASRSSQRQKFSEAEKAHQKLGEIYFQKGNFLAARHQYEQLNLKSISDLKLLKMAATTYFKTGDYNTSLKYVEMALKKDPKDSELKRLQILSTFNSMGKSPGNSLAKKHLNKHPKDLEILTAVGTMEIEQSPPTNTSLKKALELNPNHLPALYQMGRFHRKLGNFSDAKRIFKSYLEKNPASSKAHAQLGAAHYYLREIKDAVKEYHVALTLNDDDYNTWYNLGELHLLQFNQESDGNVKIGLKNKAFDCYQKTLTRNPYHYQANYRMGVMLNGNRQFKEAIRHFEVVLSANPDDFRTLLQISVAYENLSRNEDARDYLTRAYQLRPGNSIVIQKLRILSENS